MEDPLIKVQRKIIHIDMDAFYASIEQRDNPDLFGKPIVVGGLPEGRGGVVATASYEARKFGIKSAMSSKKAQQLCPHVIFVRPHFEAYKIASTHIREIFSRYSDIFEPLSLDEAYIDVTHDKQNIGSAIEIAKMIKQAIHDELALTASAGISINKFLAKIASDLQKPNGLTFIGPSAVEAFMEKLTVGKFHGVGRVTAEKMNKLGLYNGLDLKKLSEHELVRHFGKAGHFYYSIVRGIDNRAVEPNRETKSVGAEDTFAFDLISLDDMNAELGKIAVTVSERLKKHGLKGRTVALKIKYHDFKTITRNFSFLNGIDDFQTILTTATNLLSLTTPEGMRIRLLGISVSNFDIIRENIPQSYLQLQLNLFPEASEKNYGKE